MIEDSKISAGSDINRRRFLASATAVASASLMPSAFQQARAQAAPRVLTFSDHEPLGGMRTRFLKDVVFPAIERESTGRLKIEDHWDGDIAAAYDALCAVNRHIAQHPMVVGHRQVPGWRLMWGWYGPRHG